MGQLEHFIHGTPDGAHALPVLVRAALAHVQFETIHPFLDGNGRLGRLLIVLMLIDAGVLQQPLLLLPQLVQQEQLFSCVLLLPPFLSSSSRLPPSISISI